MKRLICAVLAIAVVLLCVACSPGAIFGQNDADSASSTAKTMEAPVKVTETYANTQAVPSATPTSTPEGTQVSTPATGDLPLVPMAGAIGLILICSAGLIMLRRI